MDDCRSPERPKRQLPTTITPERSAKKKTRVSLPGHIPFALSDDQEDDSALTGEEYAFNLMNIENVPPDQKSSQVRVFICYPNSTVIVKKDFDELTSSLIRNIATKHWKAAANIICQHALLQDHIVSVCGRLVGKEFQSLNSESMLNGTSPKELAAWSNEVFTKEVSNKCPVWYEILNGAFGKKSSSRHSRAVNAVALSTSIVARQRNERLSAMTYRISSLLFHSGASYYDTIRLNHLGVCMHPSMTVDLQRKMGTTSESKVILWKKTIENNRAALLLLREVFEKQVPQANDSTDTASDMNCDVNIDFSEEHAKQYNYFTHIGYNHCCELLQDAGIRNNVTCFTGKVLLDAIHSLEHQQLPLYK